MIDLKLMRDDPDRVRASQRARGEDEAVVDAILGAEERRRASLTAYERLRAEQKATGRQVATASGEEKHRLLTHSKAVAAEVRARQVARRLVRRNQQAPVHVGVPARLEAEQTAEPVDVGVVDRPRPTVGDVGPRDVDRRVHDDPERLPARVVVGRRHP